MRTTVNIEDDILAVIKEMARKEHVSAGRVISRIVREALTDRNCRQNAGSEQTVAGFRPFLPREKVISNEQVNWIRDDEGV